MVSPRILIAGGGIGGAATALALLKRGIDVDIYEQAPQLGEVGAGVQISPNGSRALQALGAFEALRELSCEPDRKEFRLWNTGRSWPLFDLGDRAIERYGYPYLTVYRPDLLQVLTDAVRREKPDAIHLGCKIAGVEQSDARAALILADGSTVSADAVIGADGVRSVVRNQLWGETNPSFSGMVAWRSIIPMSEMPEHMRRMVGSTWIGPGGHAVHYPLRRGEIVNFVGTIERDGWGSDSWSVEGTRAECLQDFAGWHEDIQTLIRRSPRLFKWALMARDPIPRWTQQRVTLVGDACHPTLPFLAQGAVHAIEDGIVLARCVEGYTDDIQLALAKFESARIERTSRMVRGAASNTSRFHSPELATEEGAESFLAREWSRSPIADRYDWLYAYDAETTSI